MRAVTNLSSEEVVVEVEAAVVGRGWWDVSAVTAVRFAIVLIRLSGQFVARHLQQFFVADFQGLVGVLVELGVVLEAVACADETEVVLVDDQAATLAEDGCQLGGRC